MSTPATDPERSASGDPEQEQAIQLLRSLGLTATEAEVYFTALRSCASEPVSSYRLAQVMGRDPANVAKILGALVRLQAMTVVQDKPRLFLPTDPTDFTDRVLARLQHDGRRAATLLQRVQTPPPDGMTLALIGADQVFAKARELLAGSREQVLVFGSKECLRELGAELEELAETDERTVRVLSPLAMVAENVELTVCSPLSDLQPLLAREFLQLVVDNRAWLNAVLDDGAGPAPAGWWGDHSPIAAVMAGTLNLAWQAGHAAPTTITPPVTTQVEPPPPAATPPTAQPTADVVEEALEVEESLEFEEGITFLMRHTDLKAKKEGER